LLGERLINRKMLQVDSIGEIRNCPPPWKVWREKRRAFPLPRNGRSQCLTVLKPRIHCFPGSRWHSSDCHHTFLLNRTGCGLFWFITARALSLAHGSPHLYPNVIQLFINPL
jgi:hypothetical protein